MAKRTARQRYTESGAVASRKDLIRYIGTLEGALKGAQLQASLAWSRVAELEGQVEKPADADEWATSVAEDLERQGDEQAHEDASGSVEQPA